MAGARARREDDGALTRAVPEPVVPAGALALAVALGLIGLAVAAVAVVLIVQPWGASTTLVVDNLSQEAAALTATGCCGLAAWRTSDRHRVVWIAMGAASGSWAAGQAVWSWYELVRDIAVPFPSVADVGFLGFAGAALVALWRHPTDGTPGARARRLLDGLTITVALGLLSWVTALGAVAAAGADHPVAFAISLAYPIADVVVLSMLGVVLLRAPADRRAMVLLAAGVASIAVADSAFSYLSTTGDYGTGDLIGLGWTGGHLLIALAALAHRPPAGPASAAEVRAADLHVTSPLPYVPVAAALAAVALQWLLGRRPDDVTLVLGVVVGVLVLVRQGLTLRDNGRLVAALAAREAELRHQAFHDGLTGLANRALFNDRVGHALDLHGRSGRPLAVVFCDLDDFKLVNDTLGHAVGDELLVRVAERMRGALRPGDTMARLGGDEFAILLEDGTAPEAVAARILQTLELPFTVGGGTVDARASVGLATVSADEPTPSSDDLLARADTAMYAAKRGGKGALRTYEAGMALDEVAERDLRDRLESAIAGGRVHLVYQPLVNLRTRQTFAFEALARWQEGHQPVPPSTFIPLAERTGLIDPLTDLLLGQLCRQVHEWDAGGGRRDLRVGLNVSAQQVVDPTFADRVLRRLADEGIAPSRLALEITESALIEDAEAAAATTGRLSDAGVHLSLDDFGTGYSALSQLTSATLHSVKVDRSFVSRLGAADRHEQFVRALLRLGTDLGLVVVAEGVETPRQLEVLQALGVRAAQGYLLGRPAAASEVDVPAHRDRVRSR